MRNEFRVQGHFGTLSRSRKGKVWIRRGKWVIASDRVYLSSTVGGRRMSEEEIKWKNGRMEGKCRKEELINYTRRRWDG